MGEYIHTVSDTEAASIRRFLYVVAAGTIAFVVLIVLAVLTADRWLLLISPESERQFMRPYMSWAGDHVFADTDPVIREYIESLGRQLVAEMDVDDSIQLQFIVIDDDQVNAFTTLGGYVFVFEGLLRQLDNENSLAMVLAHEIAHAKSRDPLLTAGRGVLMQLMIMSVSGHGGFGPTVADAGSQATLSLYSREQEELADKLALAALQRMYGHVGGSTELFEKLGASGEVPEMPEILASHPDIARRIEYIRATARDQGWNPGPVRPYPESIRAIVRAEP